ncbi:MAG: N4-gp56 family major capsid protein, partial [Dehalococcoidales bacterium]
VMDQAASYKKSIGSKSIQMAKYPRLSLDTTPLVEQDDVDSEALSDTQILFIPEEHGKVVTTTALANLQTGGTADRAAARLVGMHMGQLTDRLACEALDGSANVSTPNGAAEAALTAAETLSASYLNSLYNKLARRNVKPMANGLYALFAHEDVIFDLRADAGSASWTEISKHQKSDDILKNEVAQLAGFSIIRDNLSTLTTDGGSGAVDTYRSYAMGFNALGKAVSQEPQGVISGPFDKLARFANIGWKGTVKYGIVDQDALELAVSASSVGANV